MAQKTEKLMQNILYLSSEEENLGTEVERTYRNSPRLKDLAAGQQVLQITAIYNQSDDAVIKNIAITPEIGRYWKSKLWYARS
ncbi:MAG: hypothetical protein CM15mP111_0040 [Hyphomicrobiales bacterium]|nr:MAG: hypothetical protein CM15mP111_0040 [Hyphomicrobiales bacterium]